MIRVTLSIAFLLLFTTPGYSRSKNITASSKKTDQEKLAKGSSKTSGSIISCRDKKSWNKIDFTLFCQSVIDELKAKREIYNKVNCLTDVEDGYSANLCDSVDIASQISLRDKELELRQKYTWGGPAQICKPAVFVSKGEDCLDENHKAKNLPTVELAVSSISIEKVHMGSNDSETYCLVSSRYEHKGEMLLDRYFSANPATCEKMQKLPWKSIKAKIFEDHICSIEE